MNNFFLRKSKGISLIEVMLVIAIISILSGISVGGYFYFKRNVVLSVSSDQVANSIRRTKMKSVAMENDDGWGINIQNSEIIIFKGNNFSTRTQSFDEVSEISGVSNVSGLTQIIFSKFSGVPQSQGTITLSNGAESKIIEINGKGVVKY